MIDGWVAVLPTRFGTKLTFFRDELQARRWADDHAEEADDGPEPGWKVASFTFMPADKEFFE